METGQLGITIATIRETATRFGERREKAAWFLKSRTYVDDATGGLRTKKRPGNFKEHGKYHRERKILLQRNSHVRQPTRKIGGNEEVAGVEMGHRERCNVCGRETQVGG